MGSRKEILEQQETNYLLEAILANESPYLTAEKLKISLPTYYNKRKKLLQELKQTEVRSKEELYTKVSLQLENLYTQCYRGVKRGDTRAIELARKILADIIVFHDLKSGFDEILTTKPFDTKGELSKLYDELSNELRSATRQPSEESE